MVVALTGAVITEENGSRIGYRKKCQQCGFVEGGTTHTTAPSSGNTMVSGFMCQKCRSMNEVCIQG